MFDPESAEYKLLLQTLKRQINSRYVVSILDHFKWSYDDLLWFKGKFPRARGLRAGRRQGRLIRQTKLDQGELL